MIPSSEVFRLPRACSSIPFVPSPLNTAADTAFQLLFETYIIIALRQRHGGQAVLLEDCVAKSSSRDRVIFSKSLSFPVMGFLFREYLHRHRER